MKNYQIPICAWNCSNNTGAFETKSCLIDLKLEKGEKADNKQINK